MTIDHAAEARRIIHESTHDAVGLLSLDLMEDRELSEYHASMVEAHVHATLALVEAQREANEQARIANIIALGQVRSMDGDRPFRHLIMQPINEYDVGPTDDIKKGLGL